MKALLKLVTHTHREREKGSECMCSNRWQNPTNTARFGKSQNLPYARYYLTTNICAYIYIYCIAFYCNNKTLGKTTTRITASTHHVNEVCIVTNGPLMEQAISYTHSAWAPSTQELK